MGQVGTCEIGPREIARSPNAITKSPDLDHQIAKSPNSNHQITKSPNHQISPKGVIVDFAKLNGLVPAVVQDATSNEVLMVGFMNDEAWAITQRSGFVTFYSRSRDQLWTKGETSGNRLAVRQIFVDCDEDTVLVKVDRLGDGNVCHTGARSCFCTEVPR
jgi:phosphoribosyl-ATP pyrophosphohydrolase/phosphoribosyl-AMP cyclohydrolase